MPVQLTRNSQYSRQRWLEITLIFVVFFAAGGAPVPHVNETHYLAKAKQYWQPEWCEGDLFLESGKAHLTFYWTVGVLTKWFDLPIVAWIGRVAAWLTLAIGWERLSRSVALPALFSVVAAASMVALVDWTNFAGEWVIGGVEGKCFAYGFVFFGLANLATGHWQRVWPLLGLASAFHVLVGGWSVVAAGMVWASEARGQRASVTSMLPSLAVGGAIAMLGVVPALLLAGESSSEVVEQANQVYVFDRLSHHLAPLTLPSNELGKKTLRFGTLLLGFAWLRFFCTRLTVVDDQQDRSGHAVDLLMRFALATLAISAAGFAWELIAWNHPAIAAKVLKFYVFRLADIAIPVAASLGGMWLINGLLRQRSTFGVVLLLVAVALPAAHLLHLSQQRLDNPESPAERKLQSPQAFREACEWVREHTSTDALFLVPRMSQSFKWHTGRSDLVTWKDVPQSAEALLTWRDRVYDVHYYIDEFGERKAHRSLAIQGTERIRELAEKYRFDYLLTKEYPPLSLPVVYANEVYTIYRTGTEPEN